jgi:hypothetical protein
VQARAKGRLGGALLRRREQRAQAREEQQQVPLKHDFHGPNTRAGVGARRGKLLFVGRRRAVPTRNAHPRHARWQPQQVARRARLHAKKRHIRHVHRDVEAARGGAAACSRRQIKAAADAAAAAAAPAAAAAAAAGAGARQARRGFSHGRSAHDAAGLQPLRHTVAQRAR